MSKAHEWTFYTWETDTFDEPSEAVERYEMIPGEVLTLNECKVISERTRYWKVREDGGLDPVKDGTKLTMRPGWLQRQLDRASLEVRAFELIDDLYTQGRLGKAVEMLEMLLRERKSPEVGPDQRERSGRPEKSGVR